MNTRCRTLASHARRLGRLDPDQCFALLAPHAHLPQVGGPSLRQRVFTHWRTFWLFLFQTLSPGQACRETVQAAKVWLGLDEISDNTSAYCQARGRLPQSLLEETFAGGAKALCAQVPPAARWRGRRVQVVDGTSVRLPDTPANQREYPQPKTQKPGCGFPVLRLVVLFCLSCGALDTLRQWRPLPVCCGKSQRKGVLERFLAALGAHVLPDRPGRVEPRAIKTRPKNYPLLTRPRHAYVEIPHRNRYRKSKPALS